MRLSTDGLQTVTGDGKQEGGSVGGVADGGRAKWWRAAVSQRERGDSSLRGRLTRADGARSAGGGCVDSAALDEGEGPLLLGASCAAQAAAGDNCAHGRVLLSWAVRARLCALFILAGGLAARDDARGGCCSPGVRRAEAALSARGCGDGAPCAFSQGMGAKGSQACGGGWMGSWWGRRRRRQRVEEGRDVSGKSWGGGLWAVLGARSRSHLLVLEG